MEVSDSQTQPAFNMVNEWNIRENSMEWRGFDGAEIAPHSVTEMRIAVMRKILFCLVFWSFNDTLTEAGPLEQLTQKKRRNN